MISSEEEYHDDFVFVWLDSSVCNFSQRHTSIHQYINSTRSFRECEKCIEYLQSTSNKHIFLISSGSFGEQIIPQVHELEQVICIYIFCFDKSKHSSWTAAFVKVQGVFDDENQLADKLCIDVQCRTRNLMPLSFFNPNERSIQCLTSEETNFMWFQLLIEVILRLELMPSAREEMRIECRTAYVDNQTQLQIIDEFFGSYESKNAVRWYTRDAFLYRLLNKAFRTQHIETIFKYRFVLIDLYKQLNVLNQQQFAMTKEKLTVYRGQFLRTEELAKLETNQGQLISTNSFLSTTRSSSTACGFAENSNVNPLIQNVLFEIEIYPSSMTRPFADISSLSYNKSEDEILIAMGMVFRIVSVEKHSETLWLVILEQSSIVNENVIRLNEHYKNEIGTVAKAATLGYFHSKCGEFSKAERYYRAVLDQLPADHEDRGIIMNNLGEVCRQQHRYDEAITYFEQALSFMSARHDTPNLIIIHSNIAILLLVFGRDDEAKQHIQTALDLLLTRLITSDSHILAIIYNNMGKIYEYQLKHSMALEFYEKTLLMEEQVFPPSHPSLGMTHQNIASSYFEMGDYPRSISHYEIALNIYENSLPSDHSLIGDVHICLGGIYGSSKRYKEALPHLEKAERILAHNQLTYGHWLHTKARLNFASLLIQINMHDRAMPKLSALYKVLIDSRFPRERSALIQVAIFLAMLYCRRNDHATARSYLMTAAKYLETLLTPQNYKKYKDMYVEIAHGFQCCEDHEQAIKHSDVILTFELACSDEDNLSFLSIIYNNLGVSHDRLNNTYRALEYYQSGLNIMEKIEPPNYQTISIAHRNIGSIHLHHKDFARAQVEFHHAIDSAKLCTQIDHLFISLSLNRLGHADFGCGMYADAKTHYELALKILIEHLGPNYPSVPSYEQALRKAEEELAKTVMEK